jgi:hypothetical protein
VAKNSVPDPQVGPVIAKNAPQVVRELASREQLDRFLTQVSCPSALEVDWDGLPCVEAPRAIIEQYLRLPAELANFDGPVGFFIYGGVKVFEEGKRRGKPVERLT